MSIGLTNERNDECLVLEVNIKQSKYQNVEGEEILIGKRSRNMARMTACCALTNQELHGFVQYRLKSGPA